MNANDILQKGVPSRVDKPLLVSIQDLQQLLKYSNTNKAIKDAQEEFYKKISDKYGKYFCDFLVINHFLLCCEIYLDENTLDKKLIYTPTVISSGINLLYLNKELDINSDRFDEYCNYLENISLEEFKNKYQILYRAYKSSWDLNYGVLNLKKNAKRLGYSELLRRKKQMSDILPMSKESFDHIWNHANSKYDYKMFIHDFIECLKVIRNNIYSFDSPTNNNNNINDCAEIKLDIDKKDKDRFEMFMAYTYQKYVKNISKDSRQAYFTYLSEYYHDNQDLLDNNTKLFLPYENVFVTSKDMYEEYKNILVDNPELKIVDFKFKDFNGMTIDEIEEFMDEYLKTLQVNWDFLSSYDLDNTIIERVKSYYEGHDKPYNPKTVQQLLDILLEKKEFFDRSDPTLRIMGKNSFDGYIGFLYSNGFVVLEKFFEDSKSGKIATNQAIYVMDVDDFSRLTMLSKNNIIANKLCKRFIHKGDWQSKVEEIINKPGESRSIDEIKNKLI